MEKLFSKVFTNDYLFTSVTILNILFMLISAVWFAAAGYFLELYFMIMEILGFAFLYYTYKKHMKNVMKALMGFIFGILISYFSMRAVPVILTNTVYARLELLICALVIVMAVFHFIINSNHHSSPKLIFANQIFFLISFIAMLVFTYFLIQIMPEELTLLDRFVNICHLATYVLECAAIICVESKLDAFRIKRESINADE